MEEKKKSKIGIIIAGICVLVAVIVVVVLLIPKGGASKAEDAAKEAMVALAKDDEALLEDIFHSEIGQNETVKSLYEYYDIQEDSISVSETTKRTVDAQSVNSNYGTKVSAAKMLEVKFDATYMGATGEYLAYVCVVKDKGRWYVALIDPPMPVSLLEN